MITRYFLTMVFILGNFAQSQIISKGMPLIEHYKNSEVLNLSHIWDIDEAPNGIMYFVNDIGLLEYDGNDWRTFKGSKGITRSIVIKSDNVIFTGSDNDFGVWNKRGNNFYYRSLFSKNLKRNNPVEEFWNIYKVNDCIIFQSFYNLYCYENEQITKIQAPSKFITGNSSSGKVFLVDNLMGIMQFKNYRLEKLNFPITDSYSNIISIDEQNQYILLIYKNKIDFFDKSTYKLLKTLLIADEVFSYTSLGNNYFALGTIQNGIKIYDINGKEIHFINKIKGLQNNTILSMNFSSQGNLWLGLDFGIDMLPLSSNVSYIFDNEGKIGTTYSALIDNDLLYLGTNQGLYTIPFQNLSNTYNSLIFNPIKQSSGQVWTLKKIGNKLLCGHNNGLFEIKNGSLISIDSKPGVWSIEPFGNYILTGNYNGIHVYQNTDSSIKYIKSLNEVIGSCNQVIGYKNFIFVMLPKEGVLELQINNQFQILKKKLYPISLFKNQPIQINIQGNDIQVNTINSIYTKPIEKSTNFSIRNRIYPKSLESLLSHEYFLPNNINSQYKLYTIYNGFALSDHSISKRFLRKKITKPMLRNLIAYNNQEVKILDTITKIKYKWNNVRIKFICPNTKDISYQYFLEGYSKKWSDNSTNTEAEFVNLKEGVYTLKVRAKNSYETLENEIVTFTIEPPIYRTWYAFLLYILLLFLIIYYWKQYHKHKLLKQKLQMLKNQKEKLNEQSQKYNERIMEEKNKKLELEQQQLKRKIEDKELELAKKIIDQKEINALIKSIIKKVEDTQNNATQKLSQKNYNEIIHFLDKKMNKELNKEYEIAFDNSQAHFHENILKAHPSLSSKDLRISSYLLMNLSSKEIAKILQVLPSSIDVSRSRLRKKFNLSDKENLRDFLMKFNTNN